MRTRFVLAAATLACAAVAGAWGGRAPAPREAESVSAADCGFELIARNSSGTDVYLDLYTGKVYRYTSWAKQLKMQNARVGPGVTIPPQRVTVSWKCTTELKWNIPYRIGKGTQRFRYFTTDENTRVSSSSGRRVLDLGDVGRW